MLIWVLFAALTAIAACAVLIPYARSRQAVSEDGSPGEQSSDIQVYKDQLREVERDAARGVLPQAQAEAARTEISRRLLRSVEDAQDRSELSREKNTRGRWIVLLTAFAFVPAATLAIYLSLGSPEFEDQPLAQRIATAVEDQDAAILIARVEQAVGENPDDVRGWSILAPIYARQGRFADSRLAYQQIIRLRGESSDLLGALGQVITVENQGLVTTEAQGFFERALAIDPTDRLSRYYSALAQVQEGNANAARPTLQALRDGGGISDPWASAAVALLSQVENGAAAAVPNGQAVLESAEAIAALPEAERRQAIEQMVAGLAQRLQDQPDDLPGWSRLIRSYATLGQTQEARQALEQALTVFRTDNPARLRLLTIAEETGIGTSQ